jgi:hypothetical protein
MVEGDVSFIVGNRAYFVRTLDFERLMGDPEIDYIGRSYQPKRRHSTLGNLSPVRFKTDQRFKESARQFSRRPINATRSAVLTGFTKWPSNPAS